MSQSWHDRNRKSCLLCGLPCYHNAKYCKPCVGKGKRVPTLDRLKAKTFITESECWEFTGFRLPNGYGRISNGGSGPELSHRVSWIIHFGDIPEGLIVCHKCDNPPCWNPDHLFLGSHGDNYHDMVDKGRLRTATTQPKKQGMKHHNAKLTQDQVFELIRRKSEPRKVLAAEFGLSDRYVSNVICGVSWKHLQVPVVKQKFKEIA